MLDERFWAYSVGQLYICCILLGSRRYTLLGSWTLGFSGTLLGSGYHMQPVGQLLRNLLGMSNIVTGKFHSVGQHYTNV